MARVLHLILLPFFLPFSAAQRPNGSVSVGASLTAAPDVRPWLSPNEDFAFGFHFQEDLDLFMLAIWYNKIPDRTRVWYPADCPPVLRGSKVELTDVRGLVLSDPQGGELWASEISSSPVAYGVMNDTGNFVLVRSNSSRIWESFNFPSDTMLPTQVMERGGVINSKISGTNFSSGRFQLRLLLDGNLVLNTRDISSGFAYDAYWSSETFNSSNSTNSGDRLIFEETGYLYILLQNGERFDLTPEDTLPPGDYYHRATLDSNGVFTQYYRAKNPTGNTSWEVVWFKPKNICANIRGNVGRGACGFNNVCSLADNLPNCECPRGFSLLDPSDPNGDCNPDFIPSCDEGELTYGEEDALYFIELTNVDWPTDDYLHMKPITEQNCKNSCLKDCFCAVAIYRNNECWMKKLPLSNGRNDTLLNAKAFLKSRKGIDFY